MISAHRMSRWAPVALAGAALWFASGSAVAAVPDAAAVALHPRIMLSQGEVARLQAAADKGIDALRRYVWRTRIIYNYYLPDLL